MSDNGGGDSDSGDNRGGGGGDSGGKLMTLSSPSTNGSGVRFDNITIDEDKDMVDESVKSEFAVANPLESVDNLRDPLISRDLRGPYVSPAAAAASAAAAAAAAAEPTSSQQQQQQAPHWEFSVASAHALADSFLDVATRAMIFLVDAIRQQMRRESVRSVFRLLRRAGHYLAFFTLLAMMMIIPYVLYGALKDRKLDLAAFNSAGVMTCGTVIISLRLVYLHLTHWYMPEVQKYVVRILWMVPLYSVHSWLSLRFHESRIYIDTVRDLYEAYVIASFVYYLIALLGGQDSLVHILLQKTDTTLGQHAWPISYILEPWELGEDFMLQCKHGVLQYVVFKIFATVLTYAFQSVGLYCEGTFDWKVAYPYICFFQNVSVMYALYCLVILYNAVKEELQHPINWNPLGKFLCVKGVVFFCWWQGILIFWLRAHGIIGDLGDWTAEDVAYGLIDYCIVIEMVGFAIAHSYTFTYQEYLPSNLPSPHVCDFQHYNDNNITHGEDQDLLGRSGGDAQESNLNFADDVDHNCNINNYSSRTHDFTNSQSSSQQQRGVYRPPETLERPMKFKDALWTSANPKDTIKDIQQFRKSIKLDERIEGLRPPALFRPAAGSQDLSTTTEQVQSVDETHDEDRAPSSEQSFVQRLRTGINNARNDLMGPRTASRPGSMISLNDFDSNVDNDDNGDEKGTLPEQRFV